jgi:hypothetical protein
MQGAPAVRQVKKARRSRSAREKSRPQQRGFQELRELRSKTRASKDASSEGCKSSDKFVPSKDEIKSALARIRNYTCSSAKKRRLIARVLRLEKTLFTPKEMMKTGKGPNKTLYTHPYTGHIYGVSKVTTDCVGRYVYTRNVDNFPDQYNIDKKISLMQTLIQLLTEYELPDWGLKILRRVSVCFAGLEIHPFVNLVGRTLTQSLRLQVETKLETKLRRRPKPARTGERIPSYRKKRGVVRHPRYGDIPVFLTEDRNSSRRKA